MDIDSKKVKMDKALDNLELNFTEIRAGRANPAILNKVSVEYYGAPTPLNQVASIAVPEARQILIQPWDKTLLNEIIKGIEKAEIGINPMNDGTSIRLIFPELTEERRKEIVKDIKRMSEEAKVAIRNVRRDAMEEAKGELKNKEISEDEEKSLEEEIQKITDSYISKVDEMTDKKINEIMTV